MPIIDLDELKPQAVFKFRGKEYPLKAMTSPLYIKWDAIRGEIEKRQRRIAQSEEKLKDSTLGDDQIDVFESRIAALRAENISAQSEMVSMVLDGITAEEAAELSEVQRAKVMTEMTKYMKMAMDDMEKETTGLGESDKP